MLRPHHDGRTAVGCLTIRSGSASPGAPERFRWPGKLAAATRLTATLWLMAALVAAPAAVQAQHAPRIVPGPNGTADVVFRSDCVVSFDARGRESHHLARCSDEERARARAAIDDHRREQRPGGGNEGRPPQINLNPNGSGQVVFRDGCVVQYDRDGDRRELGRGCSDDQVRRADAAMAAQRREQGWGGAGSGAWGTPQVTLERNGSGQVVFRDGCKVQYDRDGDRRERSRGCSDEQVRGADAAMAAHRREQGLDGGSAGWWGVPQVTLDRDGAGQVRFRNGCVVDYNRRGERKARSRECGDDQARRADAAMAAYRREQGLGAGGQGSDRGDVVVGPDGNTEVRMSGRCTVRYTVDGIRLNVAPACSPDQLKKADELETRFRIGRLNQQGQGN